MLGYSFAAYNILYKFSLTKFLSQIQLQQILFSHNLTEF